MYTQSPYAQKALSLIIWPSSFPLPKQDDLEIKLTWTPNVCRIVAVYGRWAMCLPAFKGVGFISGVLQGRVRFEAISYVYGLGLRAEGIEPQGLGFRV